MIGVLVAALVCSLNAFIVFRARGAVEALIRGHADGSVVAALRAGLARAWLPIGLAWAGGLFVFFVFGLSLGLLSYFDAAVNSFAVVFVLLVFEGLAERGAHNAAAPEGPPAAPVDRLLAFGGYRVMRAVVLLAAVSALAWIWIDAIELSVADAVRAKQSTAATVATTLSPISPGNCSGWRSTAMSIRPGPARSCPAPTMKMRKPRRPRGSRRCCRCSVRHSAW